MIVWGGQGANGSLPFLNTGGRYNPDTDSWAAISTTNVPTARQLHTAVWTGSEMIVWGGQPADDSGGRYCAQSTVDILGTVTYCSGNARPVPYVTLNLSGDMTASAVTNLAGMYVLSTITPRGTYTVTPTPLRDLIPVVDPTPDIGDALRLQAHFESGGTLLTGCAELAAHVTGNATVTIGDALAIEQFFTNGLRSPNNLTGQWRFLPASRSYPNLATDQSDENYDAYVLGDVTGRVMFPQPGSSVP